MTLQTKTARLGLLSSGLAILTIAVAAHSAGQIMQQSAYHHGCWGIVVEPGETISDVFMEAANRGLK